MAHPQQAAVAASDLYLPTTDVALAAAEYGRFREIEREQLAVMARYNLLGGCARRGRRSARAHPEDLRRPRAVPPPRLRLGGRAEERA